MNGWVAIFDKTGKRLASILAQSTGEYLSTALPAGEYYLKAAGPGFGVTLYRDQPGEACNVYEGVAVSVGNGATTENSDFRLVRSRITLPLRISPGIALGQEHRQIRER